MSNTSEFADLLGEFAGEDGETIDLTEEKAQPVAAPVVTPATPATDTFACLTPDCPRAEKIRGLCVPCHTYLRRKIGKYPEAERAGLWAKLEAAGKILPARSLIATSAAVRAREAFFGI